MLYYFDSKNISLKESVVKYLVENLPGFGIVGEIQILYLVIDGRAKLDSNETACYISNYAFVLAKAREVSLSEFLHLVKDNLDKLKKHYE